MSDGQSAGWMPAVAFGKIGKSKKKKVTKLTLIESIQFFDMWHLYLCIQLAASFLGIRKERTFFSGNLEQGDGLFAAEDFLNTIIQRR